MKGHPATVQGDSAMLKVEATTLMKSIGSLKKAMAHQELVCLMPWWRTSESTDGDSSGAAKSEQQFYSQNQ